MSDGIYRRYFKIEAGDVIDAAIDFQKRRTAAHEKYKAICREVGAEERYYQNKHRLTGMVFEGKVDRYLFKPGVAGKGWYPKKNNKEAKAILMKPLKVDMPAASELLSMVGLSDVPCLIGPRVGYVSHSIIIPSSPPVVLISVPWKDVDQVKLAEYTAEREKGTRRSIALDHMLWQPSECMIELKEWEHQKIISDWNESQEAA